MKKKIASSSTKRVFISAIIVLCFAFIASAILFIVFSPGKELCKVEYVKGYDDVLVQTYYKGEKISFPEEPTKTGYQFLGWSLQRDEDKILTEEIVIDKELVLYAKWEKRTYSLCYENREISVSLTSTFYIVDNILKIVGNDEIIEIPQPSKEGARFVGWSITDGVHVYSLSEFNFENVQGDSLDLIPIFEEIIVSFKINGNDKIKIQELSHKDKISVKEELSFKILLDASVSKSDIEISSTSGVVNVEKKQGLYYINISNFNENFVVDINNIETNKYNVSFNNAEEIVSQEFKHGENLILPSVSKSGYRLVGFKDLEGRYYFSDYVVTSELVLFAVWEEEIYNIELPKTNGMFVINYQQELLTTNKTIYKKYNEILEFGITLSNAYNNSKIIVYAKTANGNIYPRLNENKYVFDSISCDMQIVIDNVILNSYEIYVDGVSYGKFGYGTWLYVDGDIITIKDVVSGSETNINTLMEDKGFMGWVCDDSIVVNCIVQDIADDSSEIHILGEYSKKVAKVKLVPNGGSLEEFEIILVEGEDFILPTPTRYGYKFAGWYTKLVEVNTVVDEELSVEFTEITGVYMVLYAGWTK